MVGFDGEPSLTDRCLRECPAGDALDMAEVEAEGEEGVVAARVATRRSGRDLRGAATPAAVTGDAAPAPTVGSGNITGTRRWMFEFVDRVPNESTKQRKDFDGLLGKPIFVIGSKARTISD